MTAHPPDEMVTRAATADDARAMAEILAEAFDGYRAWAPPDWSPPLRGDEEGAFLAEALSRPGVWCRLATAHGKVVGHVALSPFTMVEPQPPPPGTVNLWQLFVRPAWQGRGVAVELIRAAAGEAKRRRFMRMRLWTPQGAARARRFYEREGWTTTGATREETPLGLSAVQYERALVGTDDGLGLAYGTVRLAAARAEWPEVAGRLADAIRDALGKSAVSVEHVGSTAVPGLAAKPTIDLAVGVGHDEPGEAVRESLEALGYEYRGDAGDRGGLVFVLSDRPQHRVAHLHVVEHGGLQWHRYLAFRDLLLSNGSARAVYGRAKSDLAESFPNDRKSYTAAKDELIGGLLEQYTTTGR